MFITLNHLRAGKLRCRWVHLLFFTTALMLAPLHADAVVIPAYFGWNYVAESTAPAPPPVLELVSITYDGGAGAGLILGMPVFPGAFMGMPDAVNPGPFLGPPTFTTIAGGDGETTRTIGGALPIDWIVAGVPTAWAPAGLPYPSIGITGLATSAGGFPFKTYTGFPVLPSGSSHYIVGLIPPGASTELLSLFLADQGDIYGPFAGVAGNPTLPATGPVSGTIITVTFAAADAAVPVPAALWLFLSGGIGLSTLLFRSRGRPPLVK